MRFLINNIRSYKYLCYRYKTGRVKNGETDATNGRIPLLSTQPIQNRGTQGLVGVYQKLLRVPRLHHHIQQ